MNPVCLHAASAVATVAYLLGAVGAAAEVPAEASARLSFATLFSHGAVLQRGVHHPVWGRAEPDSELTVSFAGQVVAARADDAGRWRAVLEPLEADAEGRELMVDDGLSTVRIGDVLVGEVWLCAGQSNLEYPVRLAPDAADLLAGADLPWLRHFKVARADSPDLMEDVGGAWARSTPETAARFSAVAFHAARVLHERLEVPIGLVNASWGATRIADWSPEGGKFRGMVAPLAPFPFRGVLWYQGEGDTGRGLAYAGSFRSLITGWRERWERPDWPFLFVQLPAYGLAKDATGEAWALLREAQRSVLDLPAVGMAVALDAGDRDDGHPKDKRLVGERLARLALARAHGMGEDDATGPLAISASLTASGHVHVAFAEAASGLVLADPASGFELRAASGPWHPAEAEVKDGPLLVRNPDVPSPVAVRYAWANFPAVVLRNGDGLPASPFLLNVEDTHSEIFEPSPQP